MNVNESTYEAGAFNPDAGAEVTAGRIVVDRWNFHFQSETLNLEFPLVRLGARTGEGDDDRIYFSDSQNTGWEVFTTDERVLDHPYLKVANNLRDRLSREASGRELTRRLRILGYAVVVCVLLIVIGQLAVSAMVRVVVARIPAKVEQEMGEADLKEIRKELVFVEDARRVASLAALAEPLAGKLGFGTNRLRFYIVEMPQPNAFALPGGHVLVTTALLELTDRPEELLGVIAHEIAHVTKKHSLRQVISSAGPFLIFKVFLGGGGNGVGAIFGQASDLLVRSGFSQEYETEADDEGWRALVAARIDPRGMRDMFMKLRSYELSQRAEDDTPQAFMSHPALVKRIERLESKWEKLPNKTDFIDLSRFSRELKSATGN